MKKNLIRLTENDKNCKRNNRSDYDKRTTVN